VGNVPLMLRVVKLNTRNLDWQKRLQSIFYYQKCHNQLSLKHSLKKLKSSHQINQLRLREIWIDMQLKSNNNKYHLHFVKSMNIKPWIWFSIDLKHYKTFINKINSLPLKCIHTLLTISSLYLHLWHFLLN
jgi:hypothetical protein